MIQPESNLVFGWDMFPQSDTARRKGQYLLVLAPCWQWALQGAKVILASGTGVHCSANENADLFWAVREAGSSFGIVAEFELRTFEAPQSLTLFAIDVFRDQTQAVEGFGMFQDLAMTAPRTLNLWMDISGTSQRIQGVWLGNLAGLDDTLRLMVKNSSRHLRIFRDNIMNP
ncbi:glucooligosaccharide oxidase, partial [Metarhizium majus ARSEF 297]